MKAFVTTGVEDQRVRLEETPSPSASAGHLIVDVRAISLNRGELSGLLTGGGRPGWDVAGIVVDEDPAGGGPRSGTRVVAVVREGAWAERISVPVGQVGVLSDAVTFEQGSTLGIAGLTALRAVRSVGDIAGRSVLVTGASGAVGRFAVQLASLGSAEVTALVSKPDQVAPVRMLGADHVLVDGDELEGPYDVVIDGVSGPALSAAIRACGPDATILTYGIASGRPAEVKFADFRNAPGGTLRGFFIWQSDLASFGNDLSYLALLVSAGALDAHVAGSYSWSEMNEALDALAGRRAAGKVVVVRG